MTTFDWVMVFIFTPIFLAQASFLAYARIKYGPLNMRERGWTWKFPPTDDDPFHDVKLMMTFGGIILLLITSTFLTLTLGTVAIVHHLWYLGYPLLLVAFVSCLLMLGIAGIRLWIDFGRPLRRWWQRRHAS